MKTLVKSDYIIKTFFIFLYLFFSFHILTIEATNNENRSFRININGTIQVDGRQFKDLTEYVQSDYFRERGKRCGTGTYKTANKNLSIPLADTSDCTLSNTSIKSEYYPDQVYTIPVVFHVIYKSDGTGNISEQKILDQIEVLNEDFGAIAGSSGANGYNTKIQFRLEKITRTKNDTWFNDSDESGYKTSLGLDQKKYFNIYSNSASGYLGYAYMPQDMAGQVLDGVVILYESVGGRDNGFSSYDQGRTLVHEVGHYLGLLHTFDGYACQNGYTVGDLIDDTNSEDNEHYGCTQTSSCSTADPIHNYMNYTDDSCMWEFTEEQANRIICSTVNYRSNIYTINSGATQQLTVIDPNGGEVLTSGSTYKISWSSTGSISKVNLWYSTDSGSSWTKFIGNASNNGSQNWTVPDVSSTNCMLKISDYTDSTIYDSSDNVFTISGSGTPSIQINRTQLNFSSDSLNITNSQEINISNSGGSSLNWSITDNAAWLSYNPTTGSNAGIVSVSVSPTGLAAGIYTGIITITDANASNSPQTIIVKLTVKNAGSTSAPFGSFDSPINGSTVSSSITVTGWALDDIEIENVMIYRNPAPGESANFVYIGEAVFVDGARSDVEALYPDYPLNYKSGWGYMLLTNFLPNNGNGTFTLTAIATDKEGKATVLGTKIIVCDNNNAVKPFGAIDTPGPGSSVSGTYRNQGWLLTPMPNTIPIDGSTIKVYVDGVYLGNQTYNIYRSDIASYFPGYTNSDGALAYFDFDTTSYSNGLHTIEWSATDNAGNSDGIGSRYFTIMNTSADKNKTASTNKTINDKELFEYDINNKPIEVTKGYSNSRLTVHDSQLKINELERIVLTLNSRDIETSFNGYLKVGNLLKKLPIGSTLQKGKFYWSPGPGFIGTYDFVFIDSINKNIKYIKVVIEPGSN